MPNKNVRHMRMKVAHPIGHRRHKPGDSVYVDEQTARALVHAGIAERVPDPQTYERTDLTAEQLVGERGPVIFVPEQPAKPAKRAYKRRDMKAKR